MGNKSPDFFPFLDIWDVGASKKPLRPLAKNCNLVRMFGFEPNLIEAEKSENDWGKLNWKELEILRVALGPQSGDINLNFTKDPGWSSIYLPNDNLISKFMSSANIEIIGNSIIQVKSGEDLINNKSVPYPDFIKIDTQGSELGVLKGLGEFAMTSLLGAYVETEFQPLYLNQPLFDDVMSFLKHYAIFPVALRTASFGLKKSEIRRTRYTTLFSHTLFLRNPWDSSLSESQKIKLGMLYNIFGFLDISHEIFMNHCQLNHEQKKSINQWINKQAKTFYSGNSNRIPRIYSFLKGDFKPRDDFQGWRRGDSSYPH